MSSQTSRPIRTLGVLTGGGDVPGLNAAIKALVYRADYPGIRVTGLRSGWEGITYLDRSRGRDNLIFFPDDPSTWKGGYLMPLNRLNTRDIDRQGGTMLQSTRTNPAGVRLGARSTNGSANALREQVLLRQKKRRTCRCKRTTCP
jgi:6-phosphofructokinase 1